VVELSDEHIQRPEVVHRRLAVLAVVTVLTYVLDLVSKVVVVATMTGGEAVPVIDGLLKLRLIRNPGAAFGLGVDVTIVFTVITVAVIVVILRTARRLGSAPWAVTLGLLLGGALGNLTDRIARAPGFLRGHVVDFLELPHWPVFNVADSAIVTAGGIMVLLALRNVPVEGRGHRD